MFTVPQAQEKYLLLGGQSGILKVFDIKAQKFCYSLQDNVIGSEITKIIPLSGSQVMVLNADQNMSIYRISTKVNKKSG